MTPVADRAPNVPKPVLSPLEPLLASRFVVPARPDGFVARARIVETLQRGVGGPLTLVSAPAGTGKTVAVASWVADGRAPGPVVWISLDDVRLTGPTLWSLVVEGLRRSEVDVSGKVPAASVTTREPTFLSWLVTRIVAHPRPIVLVLDEADDMSRDNALGLDYLVRRSAGHLRLVVVTRSDPLLTLHRYRLENAMVEVRMSDLAFTAAEGRALLAARGVELSPAEADAVVRRTEGWAAGLVLTAMSLGHRADLDTAAAEITGDSGTVSEYLLSEVLNAHSAVARELLLRTSVVDVLRPGLVEALAGPQAFRALTFLERGNAFLEPVPGTRGWFRYHALFRELLRAQLAYEAPATAVELHRAAAEWFAGEGQLEEAVQHAAAAEDWEDAAGYVVDGLAIGRLLATPGAGVLSEVFSKLPRGQTGAAVSLVRAAEAMSRGDVASCAGPLDSAREQLTDKGPWVAADLSSEVLSLVLAVALGDFEKALEAAARAEQTLDQASRGRPGRQELVALVEFARALALQQAGCLDAALEAFAAAASAASQGTPCCEAILAGSLAHLALIAAWRGQLRKAQRLAEEALAARPASDLPVGSSLGAAEVALAWVTTQTYDLATARHHAQRAAEALIAVGDAMPRVMLAMVEARTCRGRGDLEAARVALAEALGHRPPAPAWLTDELRVEEAALDVVSGEPARAAAVTETLAAARSEPASAGATLVLALARLVSGDPVDDPIQAGPVGVTLTTRVDGWLLEAYRQLQHGHEVRAARALEHSLRLAAPEQLRRPFREAPADVRRLMRLQNDLTDRHPWLDGSRQRAVPHQRQRRAVPEPNPAIVEPLTEKELEVLGHLGELLTTEEIAAVMFISVNTVRTHVRNILRKMSASRRNEAVRRARELHILAS